MNAPDSDVQLLLKKRARRRLVGAVAFALLAAIVLPMVMDQAPQAPVADVQIRIPGQDQVPPFAPKAPAGVVANAPRAPEKAGGAPAEPPRAESAPAAARPGGKPAEPAAPGQPPLPAERAGGDKPGDKPADRAGEKAAGKLAGDRPADKVPEKLPEKPPAKPAEPPRPVAENEAQRAAAILAGKPVAASGGEQVILIGAFSNPGNVKLLQSKLGELGIKVYTEALDTPQGRKTRVRAGPFPSREAAEKALEKMKRIGVSGTIAPRP